MKKWIITGLMVAAAWNLRAQAPEMFRYQGRLANGTNLVNATVPMSFKLYDAQSGGNRVYEDSNSVLVVDGLYSTYIGDNTVYGSLTNAMTNAAVYLELTVNGSTLSPRERLVSVPYALKAPAPAPLAGDPAAVSNEVINARWTKNVYANGDVTMSDRDTGLMWLYDASFAGRTNWYAAMTYCGNLTYAGYSDWRLPSKGELALQIYSSEYFTGVQDGPDQFYWSGTSVREDGGYAWPADLRGGNMYSDYGYKGNECYLWPVRGGGKDYSPERIIQLSGNIDFGSSYTGGVRTAELWISNYGNDALTVTGIQYSDNHFSGNNWSGILQAGGSTNITVTFTPTFGTVSSGTITVNCNKTSGQNAVTCSGEWVINRYIDNGDGTVTDPATGLMWAKHANHGYMTWAAATTYCENLVLGGYSDWRLPSVARDGGKAELDTLFKSSGSPSGVWQGIPEAPFTGVVGYHYWSGTSSTSTSSSTGTYENAWFMYMGAGWVSAWSKGNNFYVWPVRGGQ